MKKDKGFSLIELLIVVAIILIIAAIAIPNLLRSRIAANEASAVGSLRTINTAEITYNTSYPATGFACSLGVMGPPSGNTPATSTNAGLIDSTLGCTTQPCTKSGYTFIVACIGEGNPAVNYETTATPASPGVTGQRYFCSDASGIIKYDATSAANCLANGSPI